MKFTYGSGQRPLDGYTIKRGIGRGGFGEVYYAVSDGGKEVALKLVRGNQEVELRGVAQCLNLKHPNLVDLFDLRTDTQGDHWVIMEYIAGEPLNVVLSRHPQGLPQELAQQWFVALAKAVGYLHDHGIVHRDLKPANIFLENGILKVGDYGLSKFISGSQRTAQTQSVGTVHYMAPEISTGNYNRQIDIYAAGIILYEMLTGRVPFEGESAGEILMKHLTSPPDLSKVPAPFVPIVGKALAKNPAHRYATLAEMAKMVEAVGQEAEIVSVSSGPAVPSAPRRQPPRVEAIPTVLPAVSLRCQVGELCGSMALAAVFAGMATMLWSATGSLKDMSDIGAAFYLTVVTCWAVLVPAKFWCSHHGDGWTRRIIMMGLGTLVGLVALWVDGREIPLLSPPVELEKFGAPYPVSLGVSNTFAQASTYVSYFALAFFAVRWWKMADRRRPQRFSFAPILAAGFWSLVLLALWQQPWRGAMVLTTAAAIIQLVSPWEQPPPPAAKRMRLRYA